MAYSTTKTNSVNYDLRQLEDLPSPNSNEPRIEPTDLVEVPPPYDLFGSSLGEIAKPDDKIKNILSFFPNQPPNQVGDQASLPEHRQPSPSPSPSHQLPFTPNQSSSVVPTTSTLPGRDFYPSIPAYHQPTQHPSSPPPSFHQSQTAQSNPNPSPGFASPSITSHMHSRPIPGSQVAQWTETTQTQQKPNVPAPQETQYREMFNGMKANFEKMSTVMDRVERRLQNLEGLVQQVVKNQKDGENSLSGVVSNDEIHAMRKMQEQLDADVEFAKKLQSQFDQASKGQNTGNRGSTVSTVGTPTPVATPTPLPSVRPQSVSASECPICSSRVPMNELEDHVNACLESIGGGSPSADQKTDAEAKVGFWKKLWSGTPKKEDAQPIVTPQPQPQPQRQVSPKPVVVPQNRYPQPVSYGYRPTNTGTGNPVYYAPNNYNMPPPMSTGMYPVLPGQSHPAMSGGQPMFYYYPQDMPQPTQKK